MQRPFEAHYKTHKEGGGGVMDQLNICMLDGFSIQSGGVKIDDSKSRTKKIWLLLAYLIFHRSRAVPQDELHQLL